MIQPISGAARQAAAVEGAPAARGAQRPEPEGRERAPKPVMDEYVPEEKREPSGRYWIGRDGDGQPKVYFDDPEKEAPEDQAESCSCSTDQVDREIENLKRKREELERQISSETDDGRRRELERELAQVEGELRRKDNDAYRRQNAVFS